MNHPMQAPALQSVEGDIIFLFSFSDDEAHVDAARRADHAEIADASVALLVDFATVGQAHIAATALQLLDV